MTKETDLAHYYNFIKPLQKIRVAVGAMSKNSVLKLNPVPLLSLALI
jgi:hypothetical protein